MFNPIKRYTHWLHTRWPAGVVEKFPESGKGGLTNIPGVRIVGDLTGIPLLKFSSKTGAEAVHAILAEPDFRKSGERTRNEDGVLDLAIIGGGVSGVSAAIEARKAGLNFEIFEATQPFSTVANFPRAKPIYTYPSELKLKGGLHFTKDVKESLLDEMEEQQRAAGIEFTPARIERLEAFDQEVLLYRGREDLTPTKARRVIVAIGRSGNHRKLGCPGEELDKVFNRLYDPKEFAGQDVLVVGGGDSALECAIALVGCGARVTLSYRKPEFSRPKSKNVEKLQRLQRNPDAEVQLERPTSERVTSALTIEMLKDTPTGSIALELATTVSRIEPNQVKLKRADGAEVTLPNDAVFSMIGREAPLDFFRRSGLNVRGDWRASTLLSCGAFLLFCVVLYHWKSGHPQEFPVQRWASQHHVFPYNAPKAIDAVGGKLAEWSKREGNLLYTVRGGLGNPAFYYTLAYCTCVLVFGIQRIRRRRTPYVKWQTIALICVQCIPLFLLPEIILPWMGRNGWFEPGHPLRWLADHLFESYDGSLGHERAYWRAYGFILAFPLNVYNVFTDHPMWLWLGICFLQTFVIIPLIIFRWGKGAYCGWVCSCGALAETMGDRQRSKMPHGPFWNRFNMVGQAVLLFAFLILALRIAGWALGEDSWTSHWYHKLFEGIPFLNYGWSVDICMAGIIGVGLYFWFSGRVWCRFACPLAALMHIYTRFSRYRIFSDKHKCISCNVCTSVCHQGIDIMSFANKGLPMEDPECVRCSACVEECPTGVLSFGRYDGRRNIILDKLPASPVLMRENTQPSTNT
ncbi:MAG TPA: NAD(P)-binding domain-containing protein [Chthoniobacterales bacterium]|jgi:thioredoxin reductase/ferredoxin